MKKELPLGYRIAELSKLFREGIRLKANSLGINSTYTYILQFLEKNQNVDITQCDIAKVVCLKAPTISLTLNQMEQEGLIYRIKSDTDSRKMLVKLTQNGLDTSCQLRAVYQNEEALLVNALTSDEYDNLVKYLEKMKNAILEGESKCSNY